MSGAKVNLAIIDDDLKIRTFKKYPLSKNCKQIVVISGGEGHFVPKISNTSYIEFPYRAITSPWKVSFRRIYFAVNKAKACIDFKTGDIPLPSLEQLEAALASTMLGKIGMDKPVIPWQLWATMIISGLTLLLIANISGVFA